MMEIPLAFGFSLAENGWVFVQCDAYQEHATTRMFPNKHKLVEFLLARMEDYEKEYDVMLDEFDQPKRDDEPGQGFSEDSKLPECLLNEELDEDIEASNSKYEENKKLGKLEKPIRHIKVSEPVKEAKNPWYKFWARK